MHEEISSTPKVSLSAELLLTEAAATYLGVSPSTLSSWRAASRGPAYVRLGDLIRYRKVDLDSFVASNVQQVAA